MIKTIDEAIEHCNVKIKIFKNNANKWKHTSEVCDSKLVRKKASEMCEECLECAADHEQLMTWLEELKERRESEKWIKVSDRLPDADGWYLVTFKDDVVTDVEYFTEEKAFGIYIGKTESSGQEFIKWNVKAWKNLPEAYKEEGEQND